MVEEKRFNQEVESELEQVEMEENIEVDDGTSVDYNAETVEREQASIRQSAEEIYGIGKDAKNAVKQLSDYEIDPEAIDLDNRVADGKHLTHTAINTLESRWEEISWENEGSTIEMEADEEVEIDNKEVEIDNEEVEEVEV